MRQINRTSGVGREVGERDMSQRCGQAIPRYNAYEVHVPLLLFSTRTNQEIVMNFLRL